MDPVAGIRYVFAFAGYNLNLTKDIKVKFVIWIMLAANLVLLDVASAVDTMSLTNVSMTQHGISLYKMCQVLFYHHSMIFKTAKIGLLISTLTTFLKESDLKLCHYLSFSLVVWNVACFLPNLLIYDTLITMIKNYGISNRIAVQLLLIFELFKFSKIDWTVSSDITYLILFFMLYVAKSNLINSIDIHDKPQVLIGQIYQFSDKIIDLHNLFETTMSIYPLMSISSLFVNVSQNVYYIRYSKMSVSLLLGIEVVLQIASSLSLICITSYFSSKLEGDAHKICKKINSDQRLGPSSKNSLTSTIKSSVKQPLTGWGLFTIDMPLILSFLSSHVTFTILFLAE